MLRQAPGVTLSVNSNTRPARHREIMSIKLDPHNEWLEHVRRLPSPNCDERPAGTAIDLLVIHAISLPPRQYGGPYIDQLFTNTLDVPAHPYFSEIKDLRVSPHLLINRKGQVSQYVPFTKRAWHSGESEFKGRQVCNDFSIGIELEGCDEEPFEKIQYERVAGITDILRAHWSAISRQRIVGHSDIAPARKTDPGPAFDWDYFFSLLG